MFPKYFISETLIGFVVSKTENDIFRRQRICESFTAFVILVSFSSESSKMIPYKLLFSTPRFRPVFSLYMVLSYGFNYFWSPEYSIINVTRSQNKKVGEKILLSCQADDFWEWCRRVTLTLLFTRFCYNYTDLPRSVLSEDGQLKR